MSYIWTSDYAIWILIYLGKPRGRLYDANDECGHHPEENFHKDKKEDANAVNDFSKWLYQCRREGNNALENLKLMLMNQRYIWRGTPGDKADVPATKLPLTYRILTLSFPLQSCRSWYNDSLWFLKRWFLHPRATALEREREFRNPVSERQLFSGDVGYVTWRSPSYVYFAKNVWNFKGAWRIFWAPLVNRLI